MGLTGGLHGDWRPHTVCTLLASIGGEGNGNPLQCSCLENPMDRGGWYAAVHGVVKSRTRLTSLSLFTFMHWRRKWLPTPVFLPGNPRDGESQQQHQQEVNGKLKTRLKQIMPISFLISLLLTQNMCYLCGLEGKVSACNEGDLGSIPGQRRSPGEGNGNPLQYSCLENFMDRGVWQVTVHGVSNDGTQLSDFTFTFIDI